MHPSDSHSDTDRALLEGLLQLAVEGQTEDQDFQRIGEEVFARLLDTYGQQHTLETGRIVTDSPCYRFNRRRGGRSGWKARAGSG